MTTRRNAIRKAAALALAPVLALPHSARAAGGAPVLLGIDAEFGHASATSADAIKQGTLIAVDELNRGGGVLGGRPLQVVERANHAVPARSIANLREMAAMRDLVGVFCGRFSPTVLESIPVIHELGVPLLDPWAAADAIVDNGRSPNYVFRLSLRDSWAAPAMLSHLAAKGVRRVGLMMLNTSWGRSTEKASRAHLARMPGVSIVDVQWINWDDNAESMRAKHQLLLERGAKGILLTANAEEATVLCKALLALPADRRCPIASHWGVTGGDLPKLVGPGFQSLDFAVVQTFSFLKPGTPAAARLAKAHNRLLGTQGTRDILSAVGVAHAYDLTHLLAQAVNKAGSTERAAVRGALEQLGPWEGAVRRYARPFTPTRHEALDPGVLFMARYAQDGALEPVGAPRAANSR